MRNSFLLLVLLFCVSFFSCTKKTPAGIIPQDKMEDILYDFHLVQGADLPHVNQDVDAEVILESFYKKYDITQEDFDSSMAYYTKDLKNLMAMYDRVAKRIDLAANDGELKMEGGINDAANAYKGDTLDIWPLSRLFLLTSSELNSHFTFHIQADTTFYQHDVFHLNFHPHYLTPPTDAFSDAPIQAGVTAGLIVRYENDSLSTVIRTNYNNQYTSVILRADSALAIREVFGFFSMPSKKYMPVLIDNISLQRFHTGDAPMVSDDSEFSRRPIERELPETTTVSRRLSPQELRQQRPVERKVNIRKR